MGKRERDKTAASAAVIAAHAFADAAARLPASVLKTSMASRDKPRTGWKKVSFDVDFLGASPTARIFARAARAERMSQKTTAVIKIQKCIRGWLARHWLRNAKATKLAKAAVSPAKPAADESCTPPASLVLPTLLTPLPADTAPKAGCSQQRSGQKKLQPKHQINGRSICRQMLRPWLQLLDSEGRPRIFEHLSTGAVGTAPTSAKSIPQEKSAGAAHRTTADDAVRYAAERWSASFTPGARAFVMRAARPLQPTRG